MPKQRTLRALRPNALLEAEYQRRLDRLIDEMHRSLIYWLRAGYRKAGPEVAQLMAADDSPARELQELMRRLARRWQRRFNIAARELAEYFATEASRRNDAALHSILRRAGISVRFRMSRAMNDAIQGIVAENVSLIRSIPAQDLSQVEQMVMRSVVAGRDLEHVMSELRDRFAITKRRAALISRDQNNKATGALQRIRHREIGIERAIWMHSHAGKQPRPTHVAMHGREYDIARGMWDSHEKLWVYPGQLINCRCVSRPVLPAIAG